MAPVPIAGTEYTHGGARAYQALQTAPGSGSRMRPPGATSLVLEADGATAPGAIPAEIAARLFIRSLASPASRTRVLEALGLAANERAVFLATLGRVPETVAASTAERRARAAVLPEGEDARANLASALDAARVQEDALLDRTFAALAAALPPDAAARLAVYVDSDVRSRVRKYSVPVMGHAAPGGGH